MTFWEYTKSDLFDMYPPMRIIDLAKILLCLTMLLTFPLPFFSCRELLIVTLIRPMSAGNAQGTDNTDLLEPLLENTDENNETEVADGGIYDSTSVIFEDPRGNGFCQKMVNCWAVAKAGISIMIPGEEKQLSLPFHVALSVVFWGISTFLAVVSPNLGDILDLVGAATGTGMAFILPALLSFKLQGYSHLALFILAVGGAVGLIGTMTSLKKLIKDV
jgi:Transmembrane amino acid transporter protein